MWLSDLSIKRPVFIVMLMVALVVVGILAYTRMPVDLLPDVSTPMITVRTAYAGASPEVVEREVTKVIEEAVSPLSGVKNLSSSSQSGLSIVRIEYNLEYPVDKASNEVQQVVARAQRSLPKDADVPTILRFDPNLSPIVIFSIADKSGSMNQVQLRQMVDDEITARIERVEGVASVDVSGGLQRQINVLVSLSRLQALSISPQQVANAIEAENADIPGGNFIDNNSQLTLRTPVSFTKPQDIGEVVVTSRNGISVKVKDIARVEDGFRDRTNYSRLDGQPSVVLLVTKQSGTNTIKVAKGIIDETAKITSERPNLNLVVTRDDSQFIKESVNSTLKDLIVGGILACIVVFIFFMNWRMTLITIAGLPIIAVGTFWGISLMGFGLNMITLLALALCIGLLIDDAIVVRENMFRHLEAGKTPRMAASIGTSEIALAVLAMTLSIIAVFLPVAFATGQIGKLFREFGITISIAVIISLFEAFTLAPMLAAYFDPGVKKATASDSKKKKSEPGIPMEAMKRNYRRVLTWTLTHRAVTLLCVVIVFAFSVFLLQHIGQSFMSDMDQGYFEVSLSKPPGTTLGQTDMISQEAEARIAQQPEVTHVLARVSNEQASISVRLKGRGHVKTVQSRLRRVLSNLDSNTTVRFSSQSASLTGSITGASSIGGRPIQLSIRGNVPLPELQKSADQVKQMLATIPGIIDLDFGTTPPRPGFSVVVDRDRAADLGLSATSIGSTVRNLMNGTTASTFQDGGDSVDIVVRLQEQDRRNAQDILSLPVISPKSGIVAIRSFSTLVPSTESAQINRINRQRNIQVGANLTGRPQGDVISDIKKSLPSLSLPQGVSVAFAGASLQMSESFSILYFVLLLSLVFMYMVLASQLGSFVQPLIIMVALPLSVAGAVGALLITGKYLDLTAMIGMILLMGIVTKNSILLVDFANIRRKQGADPREAMLDAGQTRLRPVLMTSAALIMGMLPVAIGIGSGSEFRAPMAITIIGGLITSTFLTLLVVPVIYSLVEGLKTCAVVEEKVSSIPAAARQTAQAFQIPVMDNENACTPFKWRAVPESAQTLNPLSGEGKQGGMTFGISGIPEQIQRMNPLMDEDKQGNNPLL